MFFEAVNARKARGRQEVAIHAQVRVAARPRPVGQFGVDTLAALHQRCQQADVLPAVIFEQLRRNTVCRLRLNRRAVFVAMLSTQLHIQ